MFSYGSSVSDPSGYGSSLDTNICSYGSKYFYDPDLDIQGSAYLNIFGVPVLDPDENLLFDSDRNILSGTACIRDPAPNIFRVRIRISFRSGSEYILD